MKTTKAQRRAMYLMHAYLSHNAASKYRPSAWLYLFLWASLGGRTAEVPVQFGGDA